MKQEKTEKNNLQYSVLQSGGLWHISLYIVF